MSYAIGTWAEIPSPYVTDIMLKAGLDFTIIDMEHGIIDFETAQNMMFATRANNKKVYIRVPQIEECWVLRCLDMGIDGLIFPGITNGDEVKKAIELSMFRPTGMRGYNPFTTFGNYGGSDKDFLMKENNRIELGIILESKEAFEKIDEILSYDEIGIVYIGQYDLSVSMGIPGETTNPKLIKIMNNAVKKIRCKGKKAGCMVHSIEECKTIMDQGYEFIVYKVDTGILSSAVKTFVNGLGW